MYPGRRPHDTVWTPSKIKTVFLQCSSYCTCIVLVSVSVSVLYHLLLDLANHAVVLDIVLKAVRKASTIRLGVPMTITARKPLKRAWT